jgi:RecA/RadA recombinase
VTDYVDMRDWTGPANEEYFLERARRLAQGNTPKSNGTAPEPAIEWGGEPLVSPPGATPETKAAQRDALHGCTFSRAGFRSYSLAAPDGAWRIVVWRVDVAEREPRALLTVYAAGHAAAFRDLNHQVFTRTVSLFGGLNLRQAVDTLARRLGGTAEEWTRRLDYLTARALRELQAASPGCTLVGSIERPTGTAQVFGGRLRAGRTISLFGPGSSGKTTIAEGLAVSLSTGLEVIPGWMPTRPHVVGLLDWDEGEDESRARVYAILRGLGRESLPTPYHYRAMARPLADAADEVGRWATENAIEVLVVSPANRALRAANGDPGAPVFELYEVLREFGTTNILIDHVVGAAIETPGAAREYGSVAKRDAARGSYSIYQQSEEPGERVVVLRNTKPDALAPRRAPQAVRITFDPSWPTAEGLYDTIRFSAAEVLEHGGVELRTEPQYAKLVRILREHGPELSTVAVCAIGGFQADRLKDIARECRKKGLHVTSPVVGTWRIDLPAEDEE